MEFVKPYTKTKAAKFSETGSHFRKTYKMIVDDNGHKELVEDGKENVYEMIQSHADSVDIRVIIAKYKAGDRDILKQVEGQYIDISGAPHSLAEAQNIIIGLKTEFMKLPIEVREKFDHSPEKYIQEYGTESWIKSMGFLKEEEREEERKEPEQNEQGNGEPLQSNT